MSLYPTKARLALLRAVAEGVVFDLPDDDGDTIITFDTTGAEDGYPARRVTARMSELCRSTDWVQIDADGVTWRLTAAGRAVLEAEKP